MCKNSDNFESNGMLAEHLPREGQGREEMKQFYSWDFDAAWAAQEEWEKLQTPGRGPFERWTGAQELRELYDIFLKGKKGAIIEALYICSLNSLPLPYWCELAFLDAYRDVRQYRSKSWDDVFGVPHEKGTHLDTKKEQREKRFLVYKRIEEIKEQNPGIPIDGHLFETVGRELGIGSKTKIETMYYKEKKFREKHKR